MVVSYNKSINLNLLQRIFVEMAEYPNIWTEPIAPPGLTDQLAALILFTA